MGGSYFFKKNKNIVIFEADKGGAVVIMNKSDYINEAKKHLNSVDADGNRIYKELSYDCTEKFVRDVAEVVGKAAINKVIDDDLADLLLVDSPKAGNIFSSQNTQRNTTTAWKTHLQHHQYTYNEFIKVGRHATSTTS